jgi:hypothetical protein
MNAEPSRIVNKIRFSKRLTAVVLVALLIVSANLLLTRRSNPFQRVDRYESAAELINGKNWNWGLAFLVRGTHGKVSLTNLGDLQNDGIFIPVELAEVNHISVDSSSPPLKLSVDDSIALRAVSGTSVAISKTRCLNRFHKYCDVRIMSNKNINDDAKVFVGVHLSQNIFGLVEKQLLESVIGAVS